MRESVRLAPEINFLDETRPFIQEILVERYSPKRILREASDVLGNFGRLTRQFTQSAPQILRDLEQGNTGVKSEILGLKSLAEEQRRLLKMQTRGNLTAAAFIAGAILYDIPGTSILGMSIPDIHHVYRWRPDRFSIDIFNAAPRLTDSL